MLKKFLSNWPLKILSVILALCVWFVIIMLADPTDTKSIYGIPVKLLHEDLLTQAGKSYTVEDGKEPTVDIKVTAKGSLLGDLTASHFTATADIEEMIDVNGAVPIRVECIHPSISTAQISLQNSSVIIKYEDIAYKTFPISVFYQDVPPEGYFVGSLTASPRAVQVTGPRSVLDRIGSVVAEVDVSQMTESGRVETTLRYFTNTEEEIHLENYKDTRVGSASTMVSVEIQTMKTVPVVFSQEAVDEMKAQLPEGYRYMGTSSLPTVQVKGLRSLLADMAAIVIPAGALDLSRATEDTEFELDISYFLPEGIELLEGEEQLLHVTVLVGELVIREFTVRGIRLIGGEDGYRYEYEPSVTVNIRGLEDDFQGFDPHTISLSLDVTEYATAPGKYYLPVEVHCEDENIFIPMAGPRLEVTVKAEVPPSRERETTVPANSEPGGSAEDSSEATRESDPGEMQGE